MKSLTIRDLVLLFSLLIIHSSCQKSQSTFDGLDTSYPSIQYPADNPPTEAQISLGEKLFHEPILSLDSSISCSSCHKLEYALGDNLPVSPGVQGSLGHRNSPSLFNVAFQPYFMREGGVPTLEMQVLVPLQDENEMHFNIVEAVKRLNSNSFYRTNFLQSTGDTATYFSLVRAISNYERTLIDFNSPLDKLISGDEFAFSDDAYEGGRLFYSKAGCYQCHSGVLMTDFGFYNNGFIPVDSTDIGRQRLTGKPEDAFLFKTPSLRFISLTAPYMHDGSISNLLEVVENYNKGGTGSHYQDPRIVPLNLSDQEVKQLLAFLTEL